MYGALPPPQAPRAPGRPIWAEPNADLNYTEYIITTENTKFNLPHDWWRRLITHERQRERELDCILEHDFTNAYEHFSGEGTILCLEGHPNAAEMPFNYMYWLAIDRYLSRVEPRPVPAQITNTIQKEMDHWQSMYNKFNAAAEHGPWDIV